MDRSKNNSVPQTMCPCRCPCHYNSSATTITTNHPSNDNQKAVHAAPQFSEVSKKKVHEIDEAEPELSDRYSYHPFRISGPPSASAKLSKTFLHVKDIVKNMTARWESLSDLVDDDDNFSNKRYSITGRSMGVMNNASSSSRQVSDKVDSSKLNCKCKGKVPENIEEHPYTLPPLQNNRNKAPVNRVTDNQHPINAAQNNSGNDSNSFQSHFPNFIDKKSVGSTNFFIEDGDEIASGDSAKQDDYSFHSTSPFQRVKREKPRNNVKEPNVPTVIIDNIHPQTTLMTDGSINPPHSAQSEIKTIWQSFEDKVDEIVANVNRKSFESSAHHLRSDNIVKVLQPVVRLTELAPSTKPVTNVDILDKATENEWKVRTRHPSFGEQKGEDNIRDKTDFLLNSENSETVSLKRRSHADNSLSPISKSATGSHHEVDKKRHSASSKTTFSSQKNPKKCNLCNDEGRRVHNHNFGNSKSNNVLQTNKTSEVAIQTNEAFPVDLSPNSPSIPDKLKVEEKAFSARQGKNSKHTSEIAPVINNAPPQSTFKMEDITMQPRSTLPDTFKDIEKPNEKEVGEIVTYYNEKFVNSDNYYLQPTRNTGRNLALDRTISNVDELKVVTSPQNSLVIDNLHSKAGIDAMGVSTKANEISKWLISSKTVPESEPLEDFHDELNGKTSQESNKSSSQMHKSTYLALISVPPNENDSNGSDGKCKISKSTTNYKRESELFEKEMTTTTNHVNTCREIHTVYGQQQFQREGDNETVLANLSKEYDKVVATPSTLHVEPIGRSVSVTNSSIDKSEYKGNQSRDQLSQKILVTRTTIGPAKGPAAATSHSSRNTAMMEKEIQRGSREFYICRKCHKIVESGEAVFYTKGVFEIAWHRHCFKCSTCEKNLTQYDHSFVDEEPYCLEHCARAASIPKCFKCQKLIFDSEYTSAAGNSWHRRHFTCQACRKPLVDTKYVFVQNKHPYCLYCHEKHFPKQCESCRGRISPQEPYVQVGNAVWHSNPSCLHCLSCNSSLVGRTLFFRKDGHLYCNRYCALREM